MKIALELNPCIQDRSKLYESASRRVSDRNSLLAVLIYAIHFMHVEPKNHQSQSQNQLRMVPLTRQFDTQQNNCNLKCKYTEYQGMSFRMDLIKEIENDSL